MVARKSLWWSGLAACVAAAAPGAAAGQSRVPRIAVGLFTGERAAVTRSMVAGVFANHVGEVELVSLSEYNAAAARVNATDRADEASITAVARELRVDQVVIGSMERQGTGYRLRLRVLRGSDGRSAGSASWEFERVEELNAFANEIWEQLRGSFRVDPLTASAPAGAQSSSLATANPQPPVEGPGERAPGEAPAETSGEAPTPGLGFLWIHLGGGLSGRVWRIPLLGETTPRGYQNTAFGEIRGTVAAYYRLNRNRLGVGVEGTLGVPLGLSSQGRNPAGRTVPIPTSALELQFGASVAVRPWNGGLMRAFVGMFYQDFSLDTAGLTPEMRLSPTTYVGLRIAGEGTLPVYARRAWELGVIFGGEFRLAALGSDMKTAFGLNPDTTLGFGSWFGLSVRLDGAAPGLGLRATAEFLRYATDFAGTARVGAAAESVDDYTRFLFTVVYAVGTERARRNAPADPSLDAPATSQPSEGEQGGGQRPSGDPFGSR